MNKVLYKVWLEWDLGQDYLVFTTRALAQEFVTKAIKLDADLASQFPNGFSDIEAEGLCSVSTVTLIQ